MRKSVIFSLAGFVLLILATFKIENIEETCERTGAVRSYSRYFSFIRTGVALRESWVDQILRERGKPAVAHSWVKTKGDTVRLLTGNYGHGRAPLTYGLSYVTLEALRNSFSDDEIVTLAGEFASGVPERQNVALERLSLRE